MNCNVAIKIMGAYFTKSSNEADVLKVIANSNMPQAGREHLQALLHHFVHQGPNGVHSCLVSKPACFTVAQGLFRMEKRPNLPVELARAITGQVITGLAALHSIGIVHGDLQTGNIILAHPDQTFTTQTIEEIYKSYDRPTKIPLHLYQAATLERPPIPDNAPPYIVSGLYLAGGFDNIELSDAEVVISDFSESWRPSKETEHKLTTWPPSRAPESLFGEALNLAMDRSSDMWSLGCLIYRLFGVGAILGSVHYDPKVNFSRTVGMLGKPPQQWRDLSEEKDGFDHNVGDITHNESNGNEIIDESKASVRRRVMVWLKEDRGSDVVDDELEDLVALLESIFHWLPDDRATASDMLSSTWMSKWGLPAMKTMKTEREAKKEGGGMASSSTQSHQAEQTGTLDG